MPIYIYETVGAKKPRRFELKQSMSDEPLRTDPETGEAVRRVITGGLGVMKSGGKPDSLGSSGGGCGPACGCH